MYAEAIEGRSANKAGSAGDEGRMLRLRNE